MPLPAVILNAPELLPGLAMYYTGFVILSSCRSGSFGGEGPIPWTAVRAYCGDYGIRGEQRDYFMDMIREMDKAYLDHKSKKAESTPTKRGGLGNRGR